MANNQKNYIQEDEQEEGQLKKNSLSDLKSFLFLFTFFKDVKSSFIPGIIITLASPIFSMWGAKLLGQLVQYGLMEKNYQAALYYAAAFIISEILMVLLSYFGARLIIKGANDALLNIRTILFKKLQSLPMSFYDRQPQGRIITRLTHDVTEVEQFFVSTFSRLISGTFAVLVAIVFMLSADLFLGAVMMVSIIPSIVFMSATRKYIRRFNRNRSRFSSKMNSMLAENIDGISVIRLFGLEKWSKDKYHAAGKQLIAAGLEGTVVMAWTQPTISLLTFFPLAGLVYFGGKAVLIGTMTVATFIAFFHYSQRFINPILQLIQQIHVIQQAYTGAERIVAFLKHDDEDLVLGLNGTETAEIKGSIIFDHVSMGYGEQVVLDDLSFHIQSGEKIGFVGRTGCGKTTTVSLLARLYEFQRGEILIDKISIKNIERAHLRHSIGFVSQDVVMFKGSLRDNLLAGNPRSDDQINEACIATGLAKVMAKNDLQLDWQVQENGSNLSVGERQLVSLTRVLLNDPAILILDEATANVDPEYEEIIHRAVDQVMENRTCIIIAHRLETLKNVDRIFVFSEGKLVEQGKLDQLLALKGTFFQLQSHNSK